MGSRDVSFALWGLVVVAWRSAAYTSSWVQSHCWRTWKLEPEDFRCEDSCPLQRQIWNEWNGLSNHNSKQQSINGQNTEMSWPVLRCQSATLWFKIWDFPHFPWPFRGSYFGMFQHCMVSWFEWFVFLPALHSSSPVVPQPEAPQT